MAVTIALGYFVAGLDLTEALVVGAALAPTDPLFAAAIVGRPGIPLRLRRLLNVESWLNDGLPLPVVLSLLASLTGAEVSVGSLFGEMALGLAIGVVVALAALLVFGCCDSPGFLAEIPLGPRSLRSRRSR